MIVCLITPERVRYLISIFYDFQCGDLVRIMYYVRPEHFAIKRTTANWQCLHFSVTFSSVALVLWVSLRRELVSALFRNTTIVVVVVLVQCDRRHGVLKPSSFVVKQAFCYLRRSSWICQKKVFVRTLATSSSWRRLKKLALSSATSTNDSPLLYTRRMTFKVT